LLLIDYLIRQNTDNESTMKVPFRFILVKVQY
jgi:hypothetical protein